MATNGITTLGNRTFLYGGASGIDTSALIEAAYNQRKAEADRIDIQIEENTAIFDAYDELQSLAQTVQDTLSNIKNDYSILATDDGLFDQRTGTLSGASSSNLLSVAIDPGTDLGSYEIEVISKAKAQKVGSDSTFTSKTADLGYTGSFDIGLDGKTASTINVTSDMSLEELAAAINAQKDTTGVGASVVQVSSTTYQLVLTGTDTAKEINISNITGDDVLQSIGMIDGSGAYVNEIQAASVAEIEIDGVSYTRDDNNFTDVIEGVTITVKGAEPGTILDLTIENDNSGIKDGIQDFIDAYNALRQFVIDQQATTTTGEASEEAILFGDSMLTFMTNSMQSMFGFDYGSGGTTLSTLREVGITLASDNTLEFDEDIFDTALLEKFDEVMDIFVGNATTDNANFRMTKNTSTVGSMSFALDITHDGTSITGVSVGGDSSLFDISGSTITGKFGTIYQGMTFAYVGTTSTTVNIEINQGFADMMDATLDTYADSLDGLLAERKTSLAEQNTALEARASRVIERAEDYREHLIDKYASFETELAAAQTVLAQLRAILGTDSNDE